MSEYIQILNYSILYIALKLAYDIFFFTEKCNSGLTHFSKLDNETDFVDLYYFQLVNFNRISIV